MKALRNGIAASLCALLLGTTALTAAAQVTDSGTESLNAYVAAEAPQTFATVEEAVETFKSTVVGGDFDKLATLLGLDAARTRQSDGTMDAYTDIQSRVREYVGVQDVNGRKVLELGGERWPFPFPIAQGADGKWAFDTYVGLEEVANRRVGDNELSTIATLHAYVEAQELYARADHDGDGVLEYAQKLISSEGSQDGLYWPAEQFDGEESPAGPALADADALQSAKAGDGFNGYHYRILTRQGDAIAGGAHDYRVNGNMIAGFALVAWPVNYGVSGVKTFAVDRHGIVYEADLGEKTRDIAAGIETFNPNDDWDIADD
ncbi:hypothetical protein SAMN05892877_10179 [Rhizobium subbaraonis]|uniref:DUF2950 family protein n=1 Tax=Rhizobium subbaraonis TaxID=908946 RepID=A0A285TZ79_9HYPH|nr:DUF2950 family protein [Rhizobium subbaraonis]SOC34889.1 hypothetical protein SAMN05892877_10179 [Rhizobium subbaraonis]